YNLALRVLRRPEDAEDVLQETFLEVVRSIKQYRGEGHLWGWIRQIATSKALMRIRHDRVRETEEFHEESAVRAGLGAGAGAGDVAGVGAMGGAGGMSPGAVPAQIDLERALERLSETARAVVWLHDVEGYTHEEIAEQMGKTVSFSKAQLAGPHVRLRRLLDEGVAR